MSITTQVEAARTGTEPALICQVPSGWVVLNKMQYLRGYCILMPDPIVSSLNALTLQQRAAYLCDMAAIGDALLEVVGAYRINYAIMGNSDQVLHAHIVPRYLSEPNEFCHNTPWSYPKETIETTLFDYARDRDLIVEIGSAIKKRL